MKKFFNKKTVILFLSWIFFTTIYIYSIDNFFIVQTNLAEESFSVVNKVLHNEVYKNLEYDELTKGQKLQGEFTATNNYLGQVLIRFYNFQRINPDSVIFRIKEKGAKKWYYENVYKTDQFQPNLFFPFGFPRIANSKGKTYIFEVESLNGLPQHSIGISSVKPLGAVLFQYPKRLFLLNPSFFYSYIINEKIKKIEIRFPSFISLAIYLNFITLSLVIISLALDNLNKFKWEISGRNIIFLGILFLILSAFILYLKKVALSQNLITIAYFILVIGVIWQIIELKFRGRK